MTSLGYKVVVVAVDGLDYNLVIRWKPKHFMLDYIGRHRLEPVLKGEKPYTPVIWGSFLLGRPAVDLGFSLREIKEARVREVWGPLAYLLYRVKKALIGDRRTGLGRVLKRLRIARGVGPEGLNAEGVKGLVRAERLPEGLRRLTFIEKALKEGFRVWVREFPSYNEDEIFRIRMRTPMMLGASLRERVEFLEKAHDTASRIAREALDAIPDYDLVIYYTPVIDLAQHLLYRRGRPKHMLLLRRFYALTEGVVGELIDMGLDEGALVIVVSDHGFDPRSLDHSLTGYWSSNVDIESLVGREVLITDFHCVILNHLWGGKNQSQGLPQRGSSGLPLILRGTMLGSFQGLLSSSGFR